MKHNLAVCIVSAMGPSCIQIKDDVEVASSHDQDYDCLDLNVWTKDINTKNKPVLVFIHGGGHSKAAAMIPAMMVNTLCEISLMGKMQP